MGKHPAWLGKAMQSGGRAPQWQGEGDSGKDKKVEVQDLRDTAKTKMRMAAPLVAGGATQAALKRKSVPGAAIGLGAMGLGTVLAKDAGDDRNKASRINEEADKAEGRKRGGRASKKKD